MNPKEVRRLAQKKFREETGLFIVEGTKSVLDLLHSELAVEAVYALPQWLETHGRELAAVRTEPVSEKELERISCLTTPQEVLAVAKRPAASVDDLDFGRTLLMLDGIRDPGNLGTMVRTADWFGIRQVVCSPDCVELTNPKVVQATMGSVARVKVVYADLLALLASGRVKGEVYGAFMEGEPLKETEFRQGDIIIIGSEGSGISPEVSARVTRRISIPAGVHSGGRAESLNASIAAAIVMYEACR